MSYTERQVLAATGLESATDLRRWVRQGWVSPARRGTRLQYDEIDVARVRLLAELRHDMAFDEETVPVLLAMIDRMHGMRRRLRTLARAIDREPDEVRLRIRAACVEDGI